MYGIYALGVIMFLMVAISSPAEKANQRITIETTTKSRHMIMWHEAARSECFNTSGCSSPGRVSHSDILARLPSMGQSADAFTSQQFRSYTDGNMVVTVYYPEIAGTIDGNGVLADKLVLYVGNDKISGVFDRANNRIGRFDGNTGRVSIPNSIAGVNFPDGISMIANNF